VVEIRSLLQIAGADSEDSEILYCDILGNMCERNILEYDMRSNYIKLPRHGYKLIEFGQFMSRGNMFAPCFRITRSACVCYMLLLQYWFDSEKKKMMGDLASEQKNII
jgi:hypothetical protein